MRELTAGQIIKLHDRLVEKSGGSYGLRDEGLLESALAVPFAGFGGIEFFPAIEEKAARLAFGLIKNHAFVDGNKRIGALAAMVFLDMNGVVMRYSDEELIELGLGVATDEIGVDKVVEWIKLHEIGK